MTTPPPPPPLFPPPSDETTYMTRDVADATETETESESRHEAGGERGGNEGDDDSDASSIDNSDNSDADADADSDNAGSGAPLPHVAPPVTARSASRQVYTAKYSDIPVYEMAVRGVKVMRRISDDWLNATHILKVVGYLKPRRTKILDLEVMQGVHEKVQGGYGGYQGTWVPKNDGIILARRHQVEDILRPIFEFEPKNGDIALAKGDFNAHASNVAKTATATARKIPPSNLSLEPPTIRKGSAASSRATSPQPSPIQLRTRPQSHAINYTTTSGSPRASTPAAGGSVISPTHNEPSPPPAPAPPAKRPVGRPPRIPRPPGYIPPSKTTTQQLQKSGPPKPRRLSYGIVDIPNSPPGIEMRTSMEIGDAIYLFDLGRSAIQDNQEPPKTDESAINLKLSEYPESYTKTSKPFPYPPPDNSVKNMTHDQLQRHIILQIYLAKPSLEILPLLRDPNLSRLLMDGQQADEEASLLPRINPNIILDARQQTVLHWAATYAHISLINDLIARGANPSAVTIATAETPLMRASGTRAAFDGQNFDAILTSLGSASARAVDSKGRNILHRIAGTRAADIAQTYYMNCILEWIDEGGFISWVTGNASGAVPTGGATDSYKGKVKAVVAGFVNAQDADDNTPLHLAVLSRSLAVVKMLVKLGASLDLMNNAGASARDLCPEWDEGLRDALRFNLPGKRGGRAVGSGVSERKIYDYHDVNESNHDNRFDLQMQVSKSEIKLIHRSQSRLQRIYDQATDTNKRLKLARKISNSKRSQLAQQTMATSKSATVVTTEQQLSAVIQIPEITVSHQPELQQQQQHENTASPNTIIGQLSEFDTASSTTKSFIVLSQQSNPQVPTSQQLHNNAVSQENASDFSVTPTRQMAMSEILPTPPITMKQPSSFFATSSSSNDSPTQTELIIKLLRNKVDASEKRRKKVYDEIERVWETREDKDLRYMRMVADACDVVVEDVNESMEFI
ncbi:transcriptional regulator swi6 [Physocladia obscura]|uniref:Transcriptional regulator swi6 n=1 Tax=Physocladia obscura TaxID=109957 RepID=A0AAD5SSJ5_9FUNG|nr:transcriptional regulator swi6 [Physocladia obscura]